MAVGRIKRNRRYGPVEALEADIYPVAKVVDQSNRKATGAANNILYFVLSQYDVIPNIF